MIAPSASYKQHHSAHRRLLPASIAQFFETNFPKFFGQQIRDRIAQQLLALIESQCPEVTALRPGQCVWNAIAIETRADSDKLRLVPVILTLVNDADIERLAAGETPNKVRQDAIARVLEEAYQQGALLSMRDIGLLTWHKHEDMSLTRKAWEAAHGRQLPHPGNLQDMGSCITHKIAIVVKAVYERKDPRQVARETHHTLEAVERYLRDFQRVRTCYRQMPDQEFICQVTGMTSRLVEEYLDIIRRFELPDDGVTPEGYAKLNPAWTEDRATLGSDPSAGQACKPEEGDTMSPSPLGLQRKAKNPVTGLLTGKPA